MRPLVPPAAEPGPGAAPDRVVPAAAPRDIFDVPWVGVPASGLAAVLARLVSLPARLWCARDLLAASLARERRERLQGTALGLAWPLVQPLCTFAVYGLVFGGVLGMRMPGAAAGALDWTYGLWLWTGAVVWASVAECLARGVSCVVDRRGLVRKLAFPCEILPLEVVLSSAITLGFGVATYVVLSALVLGVLPSAALAWIPLLLLVQLVGLWGATLFVAAMQVWTRDTQHVLGIVLSLALFATPVFWVPSPEVLPGIERWLGLVDLNPLHHLLNAWRGILLPSAPASCFTASVDASIAALAPWSCGAFLGGFAVFAAGQHHFADEI